MAKTPSTPAGKSSGTSGKAKTAPTPKKPRFNTLRQMGQVYQLTRAEDPSVTWRMALAGLLGMGVWDLIGWAIGLKTPIGWVLWIIMSLFAAATPMMIVLGRRTQAAQYKMLDGQPGASVAILSQIRRGWYTTQAPVAVNRNQEVVMRTVGRAGVVLILEGNSQGANQLLAAEHKRTQRIVGEVPVHDLVLGDGPGQVSLKKLNRTVQKLPKVITQSEARDINKRLQAIAQAPVGIPKGPLPKGAKLPKMPKS